MSSFDYRQHSFAIRPMLYQHSTQSLKDVFGYSNRHICTPHDEMAEEQEQAAPQTAKPDTPAP